jgi:transposase-like protein
MARRKDPSTPDALPDQLLAGADPKTAFDPGGLLDGLKKALAERALNAEMDHHLSGTEAAGLPLQGLLRFRPSRGATVLIQASKRER